MRFTGKQLFSVFLIFAVVGVLAAICSQPAARADVGATSVLPVPQQALTDMQAGAGKDKVPAAEHQATVSAAKGKAGEKAKTMANRVVSLAGSWINVKVVAGIPLFRLILTLLILLLVAVLERFARSMIDRHQKAVEKREAPKTSRDHIICATARPISLLIWTYGIYAALAPLFVYFISADGSNLVHLVAKKAADMGTAVAVVWFIFRLVDIVDIRLEQWAAATENTIDDMMAPLLGKTLRIFIIVIGGILIIRNLTGVDIGPLLASLGVGGIAVALAAKDSIANFFGTLTIFFDRPFQVGHRVVIGKTDGVIESVGFRSTRIRTLDGHLVTVPNEGLVNTSIENIGMRPHIRWLNNLTITYDTPPEKVERAVAILREILDNHEGMHPDFPPRVYFNGFNDWSLNILMVAWYHPANYWDMQEWQQRTCLEILRRFNEEGIDFAFPSQTLYLANDDARQLKLAMLAGETATYAPQQ